MDSKRSIAIYCSKRCSDAAYMERSGNKKRKSNAEYRKRNREKFRDYKVGYNLKRLKEDPVFRLVSYMRYNTRNLIRKKSRKQTKTTRLLGLTGHAFLHYLLGHPNNQHGEWTEDNYGTAWVVDHIRPLASFDLSDPEQQKIAFHWTNCQPLSKEENERKHSTWEGKRHRFR
jgi:5-methylcytosine-specific restriction endonuclease McrA